MVLHFSFFKLKINLYMQQDKLPHASTSTVQHYSIVFYLCKLNIFLLLFCCLLEFSILEQVYLPGFWQSEKCQIVQNNQTIIIRNYVSTQVLVQVPSKPNLIAIWNTCSTKLQNESVTCAMKAYPLYDFVNCTWNAFSLHLIKFVALETQQANKQLLAMMLYTMPSVFASWMLCSILIIVVYLIMVRGREEAKLVCTCCYAKRKSSLLTKSLQLLLEEDEQEEWVQHPCSMRGMLTCARATGYCVPLFVLVFLFIVLLLFVSATIAIIWTVFGFGCIVLVFCYDVFLNLTETNMITSLRVLDIKFLVPGIAFVTSITRGQVEHVELQGTNTIVWAQQKTKHGMVNCKFSHVQQVILVMNLLHKAD